MHFQAYTCIYTNLCIRTNTAFDFSNKVRGEYHDEMEGGDKAKEVESEAWHAFLAFEAQHHILAD